MRLVTRAEWGARTARRINTANLNRKSTGHWNGPKVTVGGSATWTHDKCAGIVRGVQNFHMDGRGWIDIAYNFLVCRHGYVFEGRGLNVINAANGTSEGNRTSHAIYFMAGEGNAFTEAEKAGFRECVKMVADRTDAPDDAIGHRDHKSTACPGDTRYAWIHADMPTSGTHNDSTGDIIVNSATRAQGGFALVGPDGGVFCYDGAPFFGSLPSIKVVPAAKVVAIVWTLSGEGYWLMSEDGGIYCFGDAQFRGSYPGLPANVRDVPRRFVALAATKDGGYTEVTSMRDLYTF